MKILKIGNSLIFGVEHYNMNDVKKVFNYVKKSYKPEDRVVFMGEGGDDNNVYEKGSEQEEIKNKFHKSWYGGGMAAQLGCYERWIAFAVQRASNSTSSSVGRPGTPAASL